MAEVGIVFYQDHRGKYPVREYLDSIPAKARAEFRESLEVIEEFGIPDTPRKFLEYLENDIWEVRARWGNIRIRVLGFFSEGTLVLTHGFNKKTGPVSDKEIKRALRFKKEFEGRQGY